MESWTLAAVAVAGVALALTVGRESYRSSPGQHFTRSSGLVDYIVQTVVRRDHAADMRNRRKAVRVQVINGMIRVTITSDGRMGRWATTPLRSMAHPQELRDELAGCLSAFSATRGPGRARVTVGPVEWVARHEVQPSCASQVSVSTPAVCPGACPQSATAWTGGLNTFNTFDAAPRCDGGCPFSSARLYP